MSIFYSQVLNYAFVNVLNFEKFGSTNVVHVHLITKHVWYTYTSYNLYPLHLKNLQMFCESSVFLK